MALLRATALAAQDSYGRAMLRAGVSEARARQWCTDPHVRVPGGAQVGGENAFAFSRCVTVRATPAPWICM